MLKALFVFEMFTFFFSFFGFVEKRLDKKAVINFKTYEVTDWTANNYNIHINQYRKITRNKDHQATKFGQLIKYSVRIIFFFFKNQTAKELGILVPELFLVIKKALHKVNAGVQYPSFNIFW